MTIIDNRVEVELTNNCICEDEQEDGEFVSSSECYGCFDDMKEELFAEILQPFMEQHKLDEMTLLHAQATGLTWERVSAETIVSIYGLAEGQFGAIRGGDWRIVYTLKDGVLSARRYSHDEPMGASISFRILSEEGDC
jgi:hypothetical protein